MSLRRGVAPPVEPSPPVSQKSDLENSPVSGAELATQTGESLPANGIEPKPIKRTLSAISEFLLKVDLFKHLGDEALYALASQVRLIHHPEGHVIRDTNRDTASVDGLYVIKSGMAKVTRPSESWEAEAVLAILRQGNCFGEIGLIDGLPPSANVTAMEPLECYFLGRDAFLSALKENPEIALGMLPSLGNMVRSADHWIARLL